jgi:hypothetical protein
MRWAVGKTDQFGLYVIAVAGPLGLLLFAPILIAFVDDDYFLPMFLSIVVLNLCAIYFIKRGREKRAPAIQVLETFNRYSVLMRRLLDEELNRTDSYEREELQEIKNTLLELKSKDIDALK